MLELQLFNTCMIVLRWNVSHVVMTWIYTFGFSMLSWLGLAYTVSLQNDRGWTISFECRNGSINYNPSLETER